MTTDHFDKYQKRGAYHWDESSKSLTKGWPYTRSRIEWVVGQCRDAGTILEIGCGDGAILGRLAAQGKTVTGVDADTTAISLARAKFAEVGLTGTFHQDLDAVAEHSTFDAVILAEVIEHLENPAEILDFACRHLDEAGMLVLTTPIRLLERSLDVHHLHEFWPQELETLLKSFFGEVRTEKMHPVWFIDLMCVSIRDLRPFTFAANLVRLMTGVELLDRLPSPLGIYWTQAAQCRGVKSFRSDS